MRDEWEEWRDKDGHALFVRERLDRRVMVWDSRVGAVTHVYETMADAADATTGYKTAWEWSQDIEGPPSRPYSDSVSEGPPSERTQASRLRFANRDAAAARAKELAAQHEAGELSFEAFASAIGAVATSENFTAVEKAFDLEVWGRVINHVVNENPEHWMRGIGDGGIAEELETLAGVRDIVWGAEHGDDPMRAASILQARERAGMDVGANEWLDDYVLPPPEERRPPPPDWLAIADLIAAAERATDPAEHARLVAAARELAGRNDSPHLSIDGVDPDGGEPWVDSFGHRVVVRQRPSGRVDVCYAEHAHAVFDSYDDATEQLAFDGFERAD